MRSGRMATRLAAVLTVSLVGLTGVSARAENDRFVRGGGSYMGLAMFVAGGIDHQVNSRISVGGEGQFLFGFIDEPWADGAAFGNVKFFGSSSESPFRPFCGAGVGVIASLQGGGAYAPIVHIMGGFVSGRGKKKFELQAEWWGSGEGSFVPYPFVSAGVRF